MSYKLEIVKVKASFPWVIRATVDGASEPRYRGYHYKKEAIAGMAEWEGQSMMWFGREFLHNFDSAELLGIKKIIT